MPDPLKLGHIPDQNPATPKRMPGHTATPRASHWHFAPWVAGAMVIAVVVLYSVGMVGH